MQEPATADLPAPRDIASALWRGARCRCPACGKGRLFNGFLSVNPACPACGEALHHQRADDAPAYFTIFIVGHVAVGGVLWAERAYMPPAWLQAGVWLTVALVLSLWLLPRIKGMLIGLQWALRMHGFAGPVVEHEFGIAPAHRPDPRT
ncbi:MAG: DUF983 domain-containing protein [Hyphomicrobiaceae bacterium]|nr:DUF983 domain-containing protein [Hyphomicrobiaceae bacterium]